MADIGSGLLFDEHGNLLVSPDARAFRIALFNNGKYYSPFLPYMRPGYSIGDTVSADGAVAEMDEGGGGVLSNIASSLDGKKDLSFFDLDNAKRNVPFAGMAISSEKGLVDVGAPYAWLSLIGVPHGAVSFVGGQDLVFPDLSYKLGNLYDRAKYFLGAEYLGKKSPVEQAVLEHFREGDYYKGLSAKDKKLVDSAGTFDKLKDILLGMEIRKMRPMSRRNMEAMMSGGYLDGLVGKYVPGYVKGSGVDFFGRDDAGWKDFMVDRLVHSIMRTAAVSSGGGNLGNYRVLQVEAPLSSILGADDVLLRKGTQHRDFAGEHVVDSYVPLKDIGSIDKLLAEGGAIDNYWRIRNEGASAEDAWERALAKTFGPYARVLSDEDKKSIYGSMRDEFGNYLSRQNIVGALKRGPGGD